MVLQQMLFQLTWERRSQNLMPIHFYCELNWEINSTDSIFSASNFQILMIVCLYINWNISTDVKYLWLLLFIVQLELLFEHCLSGGFTIACMSGFLLIFYSGHKSSKSSKASIRPKSFYYSTIYPTTNPTRPPWLITKSSRFIRSPSCGYEPKITLTSSSKQS